jgi:Zn-dependent protease with chaperone function
MKCCLAAQVRMAYVFGARLVLSTMLALWCSAATAATLVWEIKPHLLNSYASTNLKDKQGNTVLTLQTRYLQTLYVVKEKIRVAAGLHAVRLGVSNDRTPNASAGSLPDGQHVVVFTAGMVNHLKDDEGLIAAIMGHEFGHVVKNHTGRSERRAAVNIIGFLAGLVAGNSGGRLAAELTSRVASLGAQAVIHSYDRDQEREADAFAVEVMPRVGYNPEDAVRFWSVMNSLGSSGGLFSTHPATAERVASTQRLVASHRQTTVAQASQSQAMAIGATSPAETISEQPSPVALSVMPPSSGGGRASVQSSVPSQPVTAASEQVVAYLTPPTVPTDSAPKAEQSEKQIGLPDALNGLAPARNGDGAWGYVNKEGRWIIAPTFTEARPFDRSGWAAVAVGPAVDPRWGFINGRGEWEIPARFLDADSFDPDAGDRARVRLSSEAAKGYTYIDRSGQVSVQP